MARFSFAGGEPIPATVAPQGWLPAELGDLALLELDRDPPPSARPASLRPARTVAGHSCAAYGYPRGSSDGLSIELAVTGQTVDRLQLRAQVAHGHQIERGFSGTGLFDAETGAVVGLVVTRDKSKDVLGGYAIPLQAAVAAFPQLGPWVGWRLGTDRFLRQHWRPRARGVYQDTTPGWYFTGRTALMRELTGWLERGLPDRVVRVVTGPAGTGKSAVLAWLCALSDPQLRAEIAAARPSALAEAAAAPAAGRVSAGVWARDQDADGAAYALAAALTLPVTAGAGTDDVLAAVGDLDSDERTGLVVVLDALDEAREPRQIARRLLVPLVRDLGVKVLAGTRSGRDDELLAAFGGRLVVYRLDDPDWFDPRDLVDYVTACLRADFDPDLPSGYRTDSEACGQVAEAIADEAISNFLVAGLAARARAGEPVIDVSAPGWRHAQQFPAEVGQAFDDYLTRFGEHETRARNLLRTLSYAEGPGLPADELWADMASALAAPHRYSSDDLAWLLDSSAGYLVESGDEHGERAYRIFHQALIEHLRPQDKEIRTQRELTKVLIRAVPAGASGSDWAHASSYIRGHLAAHASAAGLLDGLLEDPGFLITADPAGLLPALDSAGSPRARQIAWFYRIAADEMRTGNLAERAAHLQLAAGKVGQRLMADAFGAAAGSGHWRTRVLSWRPPGRYTALGSTGPAAASALTVTARGEVFVVTAEWGPSVALWRLDDDGLVPVGDPQPREGLSGVTAVAVGQLGDRPVAITGDGEGSVALWRLDDEGLVFVDDQCRGHSLAGVTAAATGQFGGRPVAVTGGGNGSVALWRLDDEGLVLVGDPQVSHSGLGVTAVAVGRLNGRPVAVTGGSVGQLALWRLDDDGLVPVGNLRPGHHLGVRAVAVGQMGGAPVAVTAGYDGSLALWRLDDQGLVPVGDLQPGRSDSSWTAVAVGQMGGGPVAVTAGYDGSLALWRLDDQGLVPVGDLQPGRSVSSWAAMAVGQLDGRPVAVTGDDDGMAALWRLDDDGLIQIGDPQPHHRGIAVRAVAVGQMGGGPVAVTAGYDGSLALWRLDDDGLVPVGDMKPGNVAAVAVGQLDGRPVAVTGDDDGMAALWRLDDDGLIQIGDPQPNHRGMAVQAVALGQLSGRPVAVTAKLDGARSWRLDGERLVPVANLQRDHVFLAAIAIGQLGGQPVAVTGALDGTVALWRLDEDGLILVGVPQAGHGGRSLIAALKAVAVGQLGGQPVAVTGAEDGTLMLWRLRADGLVSIPTARIPIGSPIVSVAVLPTATVLVWCRDGVLTAEMPTSLE